MADPSLTIFVRDQAFPSVLGDRCRLPSKSLEVLSGQREPAESAFRTSLIERVEKAWATPLDVMTCGQVRVLTTQKMGLRWLAAPIAVFVRHFPRAECDYYPEDLTVNALYAYRELALLAPAETAAMLDGDFNWFDEEFDYDRDGLLVEAKAALRDARAYVRRN